MNKKRKHTTTIAWFQEFSLAVICKRDEESL